MVEFLLFFARERGAALLVDGFVSPLLVGVVLEFVTVVVVVVAVVVVTDIVGLVLNAVETIGVEVVTATNGSLLILSSLTCSDDPFSVVLELVVGV